MWVKTKVYVLNWVIPIQKTPLFKPVQAVPFMSTNVCYI
jgi:hypothetical protein